MVRKDQLVESKAVELEDVRDQKTSVESAEPAKGGDAHTELRTGAVAALEAADVPFLLDDGLEAP